MKKRFKEFAIAVLIVGGISGLWATQAPECRQLGSNIPAHCAD